MGTDIHIEVEKFNGQSWEWFPVKVDHYYEEEKGLPKPDIRRNRNYDLFAILADVRNGTGFAGCPTGTGFIPISEPRGLPKDLSKEVSDIAAGIDEDRWLGDHSFSWLTFAEILGSDYARKTTHTGIVSEEEWKQFSEHGKPQSWSGMVSGKKIKTVSAAEYKSILDNPKLRESEIQYYVRINWEETYLECVDYFLDDLRAVDPATPRENLRLVFGFDS